MGWSRLIDEHFIPHTQKNLYYSNGLTRRCPAGHDVGGRDAMPEGCRGPIRIESRGELVDL
jgi:hypothetical protein